MNIHVVESPCEFEGVRMPALEAFRRDTFSTSRSFDSGKVAIGFEGDILWVVIGGGGATVVHKWMLDEVAENGGPELQNRYGSKFKIDWNLQEVSLFDEAKSIGTDRAIPPELEKIVKDAILDLALRYQYRDVPARGKFPLLKADSPLSANGLPRMFRALRVRLSKDESHSGAHH